MTLPQAQEALDSLFGCPVSEEHPWCGLLSKITSVEDEEGSADILHKLDCLSKVPQASTGGHSVDTIQNSVVVPAHPPIQDDISNPESKSRGNSHRTASPSAPVHRNIPSPHTIHAPPEERPFDPEGDLFNFELQEFDEEDRELLEAVNEDIYVDADRHSAAAVCDKLAADRVWHELNDGLYDAAQTAVLYQEDLPRSTAPAELRAISRTNDFDHYQLLRDTARTDWEEIRQSYLEKDSRFGSPKSLFGDSVEEESIDRDIPNSPKALVDYASSTYDPNGDFDEEEDFAGDHNGDFGYPENNDEEGVDEEDGEGVEEEDGEGKDGEDIEEEEDEDIDEDKDVDENEEGSDEGEGTNKAGQLPRVVKEELRKVQEEYEEKVAAIAARAKKNVHTCWRYLDEKTSTPRELTAFNAFESWYRVHGDVKPSDEGVTNWPGFVSARYTAILKEKLPPKDQKNEALAREVFAKQIEWYESQHEAFVSEKKGKGKLGRTVKSMLQPLYAIGKQLYWYTGAHLLGHVIITDHDVEGKRQSFSWGCSSIVQQVITDHAVDLRCQLTDIETLIRMKEMKQRGVDPKLAELAVTCSKKAGKSGRDRNRKAIRAIFSYDVERVLNEDPKNDLTPMQFVRNAYRYHVRIINWPVDVPFFKAGVESIHKMTSPDLCKVALPRIAQIFEEAQTEVSEKMERRALEEAATQKGFEIISWDEDEMKMDLEEQATLPIVEDTDGNVIVTVSYSELYQEEVGIIDEDVASNDKDQGGNESDASDRSHFQPLFLDNTSPPPSPDSESDAVVLNRWYEEPDSSKLNRSRSGHTKHFPQRSGPQARVVPAKRQTLKNSSNATSSHEERQTAPIVPAQRQTMVSTLRETQQPGLHKRLKPLALSTSHDSQNAPRLHLRNRQALPLHAQRSIQQRAGRTGPVVDERRDERVAQRGGPVDQRDERVIPRDERVDRRDEQVVRRDERVVRRDDRVDRRDEQVDRRVERVKQRDELIIRRGQETLGVVSKAGTKRKTPLSNIDNSPPAKRLKANPLPKRSQMTMNKSKGAGFVKR
ncbi:hypothetical protein EV360DRAFT_74309 [Lentinula raphanica]|nr:hypothetical protein EV360DRAFT_74309 [Lentinula raphanica]